jgi:isoprenylcysteine carboxyl methyltransferase (ICMT) family protein YpbQ
MAKQTRKERALQQVQPDAQKSEARVAPRANAPAPKKTGAMPFGKENYTLLGICFALIVLAYTLMRIENAEDGFLALYVSPLLLTVGYLGVFYALFKPSKSSNE